uniref:N(4)-(beta-N-acetylglucosaminyl)-L-asparaginase n=1 Tax=Syphacia muris TaxID=451379 RepID=A0A158R4N6_9BILA
MDAVLDGLSWCEANRCDGSVGYGGSPDENGETRLDAMVFDGVTHKMGAVASLGGIKDAARVAHAVLKFTKHSLIVGDAATKFAVDMGFKRQSLYTNDSEALQRNWVQSHCQPNFRRNVVPDPKYNCGPYKPLKIEGVVSNKQEKYNKLKSNGHDTMGIIVMDTNSDITIGTTTNGANHKIVGRVGDSPIPGAGGYVDNDIGAAVATGDGDEMMRFLPRLRLNYVNFQAVEAMRQGLSPEKATKLAIERIRTFHPYFFGAVVAVNKSGHYAAACSGMEQFNYCVHTEKMVKTKVLWVNCS